MNVLLPIFSNGSTGSTDDGGAWTHTSQVPASIGNVLIVHVLQDGTAAAPTIDSVTNAEDIEGTDGVLTYIGAFDVASSAKQHLWIGRALSLSAMVITGSNTGNDDLYIRVYQWLNVSRATRLSEVIENVTAGGTTSVTGTGTSVTDASVTTLGPDRMAVNFIAANADVTYTIYGAATTGIWRNTLAAYRTSTGTAGMIAVQQGLLGEAAYWAGTNNVGPINGSGGTDEMQAQSFDSGSGGTVESIVLDIFKAGAPLDDLVVEIQTDSAGLPSGTPVGTSASTPGPLISPTVNAITSYPATATLSPSTTYWIVVSRTGARDVANQYVWRGLTTGTYADGTQAELNSGTWSTTASDLTFAIQYEGGGTIDGATATLGGSADWGVVGFALLPEVPLPPRSVMHIRHSRETSW